MRHVCITSIAILALISLPALAVEPDLGARLGTTQAEITAQLAESQFEMTRFEHEHGRIEVYAQRDGRRLELKIDPRDGRIVEVEEKR